MKKIVFTFGRMNPPTIGHAKLVKKVQDVAKSEKADARVYLSHTQNNKKDPLNYADKIRFAKKAFGNIVTQSNSKTIFQIMSEIEKDGYTDVIMVVGSDRVPEFKQLLNKYNGKDYTFDSIVVQSAGERDPDATGVEGMSASKLRAVAKSGDFDTFKQGLPKGLSDSDAKSIFNIINKVIKEEVELDERAPLTIAQRQKKARMMKRLAPKLARFRKMRAKRMADKEKLMKRAQKAARNIIRKKVAGDRGADYSALSAAEKITIDKLVAKKSAIIQKLAKRLLPKVRKSEIERLKQARSGPKTEDFDFDREFEMMFESEERKKEVAQDPDVKDMPGTQPKKYYKGLSDKEKEARAKQFARQAKKDDDDPEAYKAPASNKGAETKPSKHTKKYHQMFGEGAVEDTRDRHREEKEEMKARHDREMDAARLQDTREKNTTTEEYELSEDATNALKKKADKSGIPLGILRQVYNRGMAAWKTGHRPGATQQQWAFARVNSFITGGKTRTTADADLWAKAKGRKAKKEEVELDEARAKQAVAGNKVQKLVTGFDMTYKGKKYDEIDLELVGIDNASQIVTFKILHPREHIGDEVKIPFKTLRRGRFMATDTSKINEAVELDEKCWDGYRQAGMKKKGDKMVPNCVPEASSPEQQAAIAISKKKKKLNAMLGVPTARPVVPMGEETIEEMPRWLLEPISKVTRKKGYDAAKKVLQDVLTRKKKEAGKKGLPHTIEYYAGQIAKQFDGVDARVLADMVTEEPEKMDAPEIGTDKIKKRYSQMTPGQIDESVAPTAQELGINIQGAFEHHPTTDFQEDYLGWTLEEGTLEEAEYQGRKVKLRDPFRTPKGPKKFSVYVKNPKTDNVIKVNFGDPDMEIKRDDPENRKNFRARHNCDDKTDDTTAGYWSCRMWAKGQTVSDLD